MGCKRLPTELHFVGDVLPLLFYFNFPTNMCQGLGVKVDGHPGAPCHHNHSTTQTTCAKLHRRAPWRHSSWFVFACLGVSGSGGLRRSESLLFDFVADFKCLTLRELQNGMGIWMQFHNLLPPRELRTRIHH